MVTCGGHSADAIDTGRKSTSDIRAEPAISITLVIDTLEEHEFGWIRRRLGVEIVAKGLDGDVGVADDLTALERLGSSVVGVVWVCKGASNEILDLQIDRKVLVFIEIFSRLRALDDSRDHIVLRRNISHHFEMVRMQSIHA